MKQVLLRPFRRSSIYRLASATSSRSGSLEVTPALRLQGRCVTQDRSAGFDAFNAGNKFATTKPSASSLPRGARQPSGPQLLGVVHLSAKNITQEMETKVPLFLYFMVTNHPDVNEYTERISHQVDQANRRLAHEKMGDAYQEFGKDAGLAIKLGLIDCLKEPGLTQKFGIDPHMFPIIYFVRNKAYCDKLTGIVSESQIKEAVEAFIDFGKAESKNEAEGRGVLQKIQRQDNDDENAMTLLTAANEKMKSREVGKAIELYQKALDYSMKEVEAVKMRHGVGKKKMTAEMWERLKREPCYNAAPQAFCGLAMCSMVSKKHEEAMRLVNRVREEFPFATRDMRDVAQAVTRIELIILSEFDVAKDNYLALLKYDELTTDPLVFYKNRLKLVVAFFIEAAYNQSIEESLRLIRAEPKLLPVLKNAGIVPRDLVLRRNSTTPARKALLSIFEALGSTDERVMEGRRLLQLYI